MSQLADVNIQPSFGMFMCYYNIAVSTQLSVYILTYLLTLTDQRVAV